MHSLRFYLYETALILLSFLKGTLSWNRIKIDSFFFSFGLRRCRSTAFRFALFPMRNMPPFVVLVVSVCTSAPPPPPFLATFKIFSLLPVFNNLIMRYLGVIFFIFLLLEVFWGCWIRSFMVFIKVEKDLGNYFFKYFFLPPPSFFSFYNSDCMYVRPLDIVLQFTDTLGFLFSVFFSLSEFYFRLFLFLCLWIQWSPPPLPPAVSNSMLGHTEARIIFPKLTSSYRPPLNVLR